jgi:aryl-alcohol dehydrogenase-like predicted oxidoreductase
LFEFAAVDELKRLTLNSARPQFAPRCTLSNPVAVPHWSAYAPADVRKNAGALGWEISDADMAETDAIFDRHGAITLPPGWFED